MALDVNFILTFNFALFWYFLKARSDNMKKQRKISELFL
jgi:hypothetical protein